MSCELGNKNILCKNPIDESEEILLLYGNKNEINPKFIFYKIIFNFFGFIFVDKKIRRNIKLLSNEDYIFYCDFTQ